LLSYQRVREAAFPVLAPKELVATGQTLFGADWRAELSRALGLPDERFLRAVEAGVEQAPADWRQRLISIAQDQAMKAMDAASSLLWRGEDRAPEPQARTAEPPRLV